MVLSAFSCFRLQICQARGTQHARCCLRGCVESSRAPALTPPSPAECGRTGSQAEGCRHTTPTCADPENEGNKLRQVSVLWGLSMDDFCYCPTQWDSNRTNNIDGAEAVQVGHNAILVSRMHLATIALLCKQTTDNFQTRHPPELRWCHLSGNWILFVPH